MRNAAIARDERHSTGKVLRSDVPLHQFSDALQSLTGETDVFGSYRRGSSRQRPHQECQTDDDESDRFQPRLHASSPDNHPRIIPRGTRNRNPEPGTGTCELESPWPV